MNREAHYELVPKLREEGYKQAKIAELLSISQARVSQILKKPVGDLPKWGGHLRSKLNSIQKRQLIAFLELGPISLGFEGDIWVSKRVQYLIKEKFGITYHVDYMPDLLKSIGFSKQKPKVSDCRQEEKKVKEYLEETLPTLKKSE